MTQRSSKILVVDDNPDVLATATRQLAELGYTVLEAKDGKEAINVLQANPEIALLFTDIVMPNGLDGFDLAERARYLRPNIRVLYMSGYLKDEGVWLGSLLVKPWEPRQLAQAISNALN